MLSLFIRNLFFTILQPGLVAGLIPYWITGYQLDSLFEKDWLWRHYVGAMVLLIGFCDHDLVHWKLRG